MAFFLKQNIPDAHIIFLGKEYTKPIILQHPDVDEFVAADNILSASPKEAVAALRQLKVDVMIHVAPNKVLAKYGKQAGIPIRIGTSRRYHHWLYCNRRVKFSRAKSHLHEAQLNLKLLKALNLQTDYALSELIKPCELNAPPLSEKIKALATEHAKSFRLILHPGSQGNTIEWPTEYFVQLANWATAQNITVFITGTAKEKERFESNLIKKVPQAINLMGKITLVEMMQLLATVDGIVVGGTGPMHMAASLGTKCLGLFPADPVISTTRWAPIGRHAQTLSADVKYIHQPEQMLSIRPEIVQKVIRQWQAQVE